MIRPPNVLQMKKTVYSGFFLNVFEDILVLCHQMMYLNMKRFIECDIINDYLLKDLLGRRFCSL